MQYKDEDLVADLLQRKEKAFTEAYRKYHRYVLSYCYRLLRDMREAEDVTIVLFRKFFELMPVLRTVDDMVAYLKIAAMHECSNRRRNKRVRYAMMEAVEMAAEEDDGSTRLVYDEGLALQDLERIIFSSGLRRSQVLRMRYFEQRSYNEIAKILDISISTAKEMRVQAIKYLRREIKKEQYLP